MIRVDRSRIKVPAKLKSGRVPRALKKLKAFMASKASARRQGRPPFENDIVGAPEVRSALADLFRSKCAYCESVAAPGERLDIEYFRPRWQAMDQDGGIRFDCYWWLAYEWTNLYLACRVCNRNKGSRFPIDGRPATRPEHPLGRERPLLLDPCADDPDEHLVFAEDGTVGSRSERGTTTIQVLGLNRAALVEARRAALEQARAALSALLGSAVKKGDLDAILDDGGPYAGARRQLFRTWIEQSKAKPAARAKQGAASLKQAEDFSAMLPGFSEQDRRSAKDNFIAAQRSVDAFSISNEAATERFARTRYIERIEIRNFKGIEALDLRLPEPVSDAGWLMLLGENASGKSSVLQATALALIGAAWRQDLVARNHLEVARYLRKGASSGSVRVYLTGALEPEEMHFSAGSAGFSGGSDPKVAILAYGSTRLLPRRGTAPQMSFDFARVDNLFNPFEPLNDADNWLASLAGAEFDHVARALKPLLQLGEESLERRDGRVVATLHGSTVSLDQLSDGYQSVVALATDIMRVMLRNGWKTMEVAEGIVLLDEIGSHLHPRWRMRIVATLRKCFPRIQFLVSTHDPLCLRGLHDGEVVVMRRDQHHRIVANADLPPVRSLRVDQLLTSELFGLNSTIDPELEDLFVEYYRLLALTRRNAAQERRLAELKAALAKHRVLGTNQRERLMLETIDQFLAEERAAGALRPDLRPRIDVAEDDHVTRVLEDHAAAHRPDDEPRTRRDRLQLDLRRRGQLQGHGRLRRFFEVRQRVDERVELRQLGIGEPRRRTRLRRGRHGERLRVRVRRCFGLEVDRRR